MTPPTDGLPADGEPIRNWGDVRKIIGARDDGKAEIKELRTLVEAIGEKLTTLAPAQAPAGTPAPPAPTGLEAQVAALATAVGGIVSKEDRAAKDARRKAITEAVASQANEASRELVRGALATLALDGAVDLHAEATQAEVDKALTRLRASNPGYFAGAPSSTAAPTGNHSLIPPGVALHELTSEQMSRLSDEDFAKARRAARTSKLAV